MWVKPRTFQHQINNYRYIERERVKKKSESVQVQIKEKFVRRTKEDENF